MRERATVTGVVLAVLGVLVLIGFLLPHYVWHPLGICVGTNHQQELCKGYNLWSGILADLSEVTLLIGLAVFLRRHNCHVKWCWRMALHPVEGTSFVVCRHHHPEAHPSAEEVRRRWQAAKAQSP